MKGSSVFIFLILYINLSATLRAQVTCEKEQFTTVGNTPVYDWSESKSFYFFISKMAIDADGSPRAYHPDNTGLDDLKYAGMPGHWWALATENNESDGIPVIQEENDPYPGYYVSMTSLTDRRYRDHDPRKYVNSEKIPYFVLPPSLKSLTNTQLGDFGYVYNTKTKTGCYAIFADVGPQDKLGEGSIYLAKKLGINANPRSGGQASGVVYIIFPFSGAKQPRSLADIEKNGKKLMEESHAFDFIKHCFE